MLSLEQIQAAAAENGDTLVSPSSSGVLNELDTAWGAQEPSLPSPIPDFSGIGEDMGNSMRNVAEDVIKNAPRIFGPSEVPDQGSFAANFEADVGKRLAAAGHIAGDVAMATFAPAISLLKAFIPEDLKKDAGKAAEYLTEKIVNNPNIGPMLDRLGAKLNTLDPDVKQSLFSDIPNLVGLLGAGSISKLNPEVTAAGAKQAVGELGKMTSGAASGAIDVAGDIMSLPGEAVSKVTLPLKSISSDASSIMQRVARIPKGSQAKFESMAGESVGKYLESRGIYGNPEKVVAKLFDRFNLSKGVADDALEKLKGSFQPTPVKTALEELLKKETSKSSPGAMSPDLKTVMQLKNKLADQGLNMSDINAVKRLYERNVKLDYVKQNLPNETARANNLDSAIRKWQVEEAQHQGLKNLPEINKETQLAKQLMDALGKERAGSAGNNAVTLTDWIMLSGGDPTAIAGFFAKKGFSSKSLQSWFASKIGTKTVGDPQAIFGEPKLTLTDFLKSIEDRTTRPTLPPGEISPATSVNSTTPPPKVKGVIPKELQPLAKEARKYNSAEEFVDALKKSNVGGNQWTPEIKEAVSRIAPDGSRVGKKNVFVGSLTDFYNKVTKK